MDKLCECTPRCEAKAHLWVDTDGEGGWWKCKLCDHPGVTTVTGLICFIDDTGNGCTEDEQEI